MQYFYLVREHNEPNDKEHIIIRDEGFSCFNERKYSSSSERYETEQLLREKCGVQDFPCCKCGGLISTRYDKRTKAKMIESEMCFYCYFWESLKHDSHRPIIVDGTHYQDGGKKSGPAVWKGHAGCKFTIQFLETGEILETDNLWCQGTIPTRFRKEMPNNAIFIG